MIYRYRGGDASVGLPIQNAIHLAIDEANANHSIPGYTLVFAPRDDVGPSGVHDPAVGSQNVTALIGDALVAGIVGPFNSSVSKAEMPITNQAPLMPMETPMLRISRSINSPM